MYARQLRKWSPNAKLTPTSRSPVWRLLLLLVLVALFLTHTLVAATATTATATTTTTASLAAAAMTATRTGPATTARQAPLAVWGASKAATAAGSMLPAMALTAKDSSNASPTTTTTTPARALNSRRQEQEQEEHQPAAVERQQHVAGLAGSAGAPALGGERSYYIPVESPKDSNNNSSAHHQLVGSNIVASSSGGNNALGGANANRLFLNKLSSSSNSVSLSSSSNINRILNSSSSSGSGSNMAQQQPQMQPQQPETRAAVRRRRQPGSFSGERSADSLAYAFYYNNRPTTLLRPVSGVPAAAAGAATTTVFDGVPRGSVAQHEAATRAQEEQEEENIDEMDEEDEDETNADDLTADSDEEEEEEEVENVGASRQVASEQHVAALAAAEPARTVPNIQNSQIFYLLHNRSEQHNSQEMLQQQQQQQQQLLQQQLPVDRQGQLVEAPARAAYRNTKARRHIPEITHLQPLQQQQQQQQQLPPPAARPFWPPTSARQPLREIFTFRAPQTAEAPPHSAAASAAVAAAPLPSAPLPANATAVPFRYIIEAFEIPASLPYTGELTPQQRRMLLHQQKLRLLQQQAARSRRDSRAFGLMQQQQQQQQRQQQPLQQFQRFQQQQPQLPPQQQQQPQAQYLASKPGNYLNFRQTFVAPPAPATPQPPPTQQQFGHYASPSLALPRSRNRNHNRQAQQQQQQHHYHHQQQHEREQQQHLRGHQQQQQLQQQQQQQQHNHQHHQRQRQRDRARRYCSARDPAQLAFEAPTVFEGRLVSMTPDRRANFSATVEVRAIYKQQIGYILRSYVRLQFAYRNASGECDIYREQLRARGLVRGDELEQGRIYFMFVQQVGSGNFTILGQPIRKTRRVVEAVKDAVSENYAQHASIRSIAANNLTVESGRELRIVCRVQGRPPPKVTWFKDHKSINRNRKLYQFRHFKKRSELVIRAFNASDAGHYECRAKNKVNPNVEKRAIVIKAYPVPRYPTQPSGGAGNNCPDDASEFCFNGGTCKFFSEIGSYSCVCPEGFVGERCDRKEVNNMPPSTYSHEQECGEKKFLGSYYC